MPGSIDVRAPSVSTTGYADGLGRRFIRFDREIGATLECVHLRPELNVYEPAIRAQASAVAALSDDRLVPVRGIERDGTRVSVISELVPGDRLSDIIEARSGSDAAVSGLDAAFGFLLQVLPVLSRLHAAGVVHGIVAPGRVILTRGARVVLSDAIYGTVMPRLNLSRERLWTDWQIAAPLEVGHVRFDAAADVGQASLCGLMLALGRTIDVAEPVAALPMLVAEAAEIAQIRGGDALAESVRRFFSATLPLAGRRAAVTADKAALDAQAIASTELGEEACIGALGEFIRYEAPAAPAATSRPRPVLTVRPTPVEYEPASASDVDDAEPDRPLVTFEATPEPEPAPIEVDASVEPEPEPDHEPAPVEPEPLVAAPFIEPEPVVTPDPVQVAPAVIEIAPAPIPEPAAPPVAPRPEPVAAPRVIPPAEVSAPPVAETPALAAPIVPEPAPSNAAPANAPLIGRPAGDVFFQPEPELPPAAALMPPAPPVVFVPSPPAAPAFKPAPTRPAPAPVAPNPYVFAASAAPSPPVVPQQPPPPAPLRLKQDGPSGYAPPRGGMHRYEPAMEDAPFPHRESSLPPGGFPKKMAVAVLLVMVVAVAGGRYVMTRDRAAAADASPLASKPSQAPSQVVQARPPAAAGSTGILTIESIPTAAKVLLNGTPAGETPLRLEGLPSGRHTVTLITDSVTVRRTVRVEAGKTVALDVPVFSGWVAIFAPIVLEVSEGNKGLGSTEQGRILLPPGRHVLTVTNRQLGYSSTHTVEVEAGEETPLNLTPTGRVNVNAQPWAEVWIDGTRIGETPIANLEVPLGTREFIFKHPQHGERRVTTNITANPSVLSVDFTKPGLPN